MGAKIAEALDLTLPLVLQGGWAYDQHSLQAELLPQQLSQGDGLHRLSQTHFVGQQGAAGTGGEQHALFLVGIEVYLQQTVKRLALGALREKMIQPGIALQ